MMHTLDICKRFREKKQKEETVDITSKELLDNKYKEEKNGAQHFSKVNEDNYVWNFVYDDFGRTKLTTEPDKLRTWYTLWREKIILNS